MKWTPVSLTLATGLLNQDMPRNGLSFRTPKPSIIREVAFLKKRDLGTGEMAQQLRTVVDLPEILSSIASNHMVAHSHL